MATIFNPNGDSLLKMPESAKSRLTQSIFVTRSYVALALAFALWFIYFGSLKVVRMIITYLVYGNFSDELKGILTLLPIALGHLISMIVAWFIIKRWSKYPFLKTVGIDWSEFRNWFIKKGVRSDTAAFLLCILAGFSLWGLSILLLMILPKASGVTISAATLGNSLAVGVFYAILATLTGPVVEEIFYRGIFFPQVERWIGSICAAILVSLLFAVQHMRQYGTVIGGIGWPSMALIWLHGMIFAYSRWLTGSLIPGIIIHATFNGLNTVLVDLILKPLLAPKPSGISALIAGI